MPTSSQSPRCCFQMSHFASLIIKPCCIFGLLSYWQKKQGKLHICVVAFTVLLENESWKFFLIHFLWIDSSVIQIVYFPCQWWSNADNEVLYQSRILWHPPTHPPKGWEVREEWLEVWHQLSSYVNCGGFPRTRYSGNHCSGRASQLRTGAHILATGIPEICRHLISSSRRETPMHPCCPHSVASEWLDPSLMVSLFSGGFGSNSCWL